MEALAQGQVATAPATSAEPTVTDARFRSHLGPWPTAETQLAFDRARDLYRRAHRFEVSGPRLAELAAQVYAEARFAWFRACEDFRLEIEERVA